MGTKMRALSRAFECNSFGVNACRGCGEISFLRGGKVHGANYDSPHVR